MSDEGDSHNFVIFRLFPAVFTCAVTSIDRLVNCDGNPVYKPEKYAVKRPVIIIEPLFVKMA